MENNDNKETEFEPITPADFGDNFIDDNNNDVINPLWIELSNTLSAIYDPFEKENYCQLILDKNWWINHFKQSQYGVSSREIITELNECSMSYRCVMEILFQSNPSLIPCKTYRELENSIA